jgi:hypothetical protein
MSGETCVTANPVTSNSTSMTVVSQPSINTFTPAFGIQGTSVIVSGAGFTGTTDVKFNGVNSVFSVDNANQITATVPAGATTGMISVTGTCGTANSSQNFSITGEATLNLRVLIEGFFQGIGLMRNVSSLTTCDTIEVCLAAATYPHSIVYSVRGPIQSTGNGSFDFPSAALGQSYYIVVKHRNSLQTWSSLPVLLSTAISTYDFTTGVSQAFGDNLVDQGGKYAIISGDVNQDGRIDIFDFALIENASVLFQYGYIPEDITGDGLVESGDYSLIENNLSKTIKKP